MKYQFRLFDTAPGHGAVTGRDSGTTDPITEIRIEFDSRHVSTTLALSAFASFVAVVEAG